MSGDADDLPYQHSISVAQNVDDGRWAASLVIWPVELENYYVVMGNVAAGLARWLPSEGLHEAEYCKRPLTDAEAADCGLEADPNNIYAAKFVLIARDEPEAHHFCGIFRTMLERDFGATHRPVH